MKTIMAVSVSSTTNSILLREKAQQLSAKLNLPLLAPENIKAIDAQPVWILSYDDDGLQLLEVRNNQKKPQRILFVDFISGKNGFRFANNRTIQQPLARAAGIKSGFRPVIFDATGGLGADSFVFASLGCRVVLCERHPVLHALLEDGLSRAAQHDATAAVVRQMELVHGDSKNYLLSAVPIFDTIYLDPMYPEQKKTALNSAQMRSIRELVGADHDIASLWQTAMGKALSRVVVKRPRQGTPVSDRPPSFSQMMKSSRFDVYLVPRR